MWQINQSTSPRIPITIEDDSVGLVTGVLVAALRWDNGGAGTFGAAAGTLTEGTGNGTGSYFYQPTALETGTLGLCKLHSITAGNIVIGGDVLIGPMPASGNWNTTVPPTAAAVATAVEQQIMDETDGRAVLAAIVAKINATDTDLAGLTTSAIATAVWANASRTLSTGGNQALWDFLLASATYAVDAAANPTFGNILVALWSMLEYTSNGQLPAAFTEAALANSGNVIIPAGPIALSSPVTNYGQTLTIVRADDYDVASAQAMQWTDSGSTWPTLTGGTVTLNMRQAGTSGSLALAKTGTIVVGTGAGKTVRFEPLRADTTGLAVGTAAYRFDVVAKLATGEYVTLVQGNVDVVERVGA